MDLHHIFKLGKKRERKGEKKKQRKEKKSRPFGKKINK